MELQGKVAIVTGAAVRLGRACALALADCGVSLALHFGHSDRAARETLADVQSRGTEATLIQADFLRPIDAAASILDQTIAAFGRADILVNSAAVFEEDRFTDISEDDWEHTFAINLKAPFFLSQEFAKRREATARAHIVNIADWRGIRPKSDHLLYSLAKSGLVTLTRTLALTLAPDVQVNAIAPGAILPPAGMSAAEFEQLADGIPLRRVGSPSDVTRTLEFLLRSDFMTGEVIAVTGGEHL